MDETGAELRLALKIGNDRLHFIRRPISTPADEGTIAFLDGLTEKGNPGRCVGIFKDGGWCNERGGPKLRIDPLTWTVCAEMERKRGG